MTCLFASRHEISRTSNVLRAFMGFMTLATAARIFQLRYERNYPTYAYTEQGTLIERPVATIAGQAALFLERNLMAISMMSCILVSLILDRDSAADALKNSKILYIGSMLWIGLHFMYILILTFFIPSLIICFPCVVIALRWLFQIDLARAAAGGTQNSSTAPATDEVLNRIWKLKYRSTEEEDYVNPSDPSQRLRILKEDTKCSICLGWYEAGDELRVLPCLHHFHQDCADHWLKITATCPLCVRSVNDAIAREDSSAGLRGDLNV